MKTHLFIMVIAIFIAGCGGSGGAAQSHIEFKTLPTNMTTAGGN
jgi:hypothetical protein